MKTNKITHEYIRSIVTDDILKTIDARIVWDAQTKKFSSLGGWELPAIVAYRAIVGAAVMWLARRGTVAADGIDPTFGVIWKSAERMVPQESFCLLSALVAAISEANK